MRLVLLLSLLVLSGCIDSGRWIYHKNGSYGPWWWRGCSVSIPAFPPEIANEICIWHEGDKTWIIDRNGAREIKYP